MKLILNILIFLLQAMGTFFTGIGVGMIWVPLAWIYAGTVMFFFGNVLYRAMKSEEFSK